VLGGSAGLQRQQLAHTTVIWWRAGTVASEELFDDATRRIFAFLAHRRRKWAIMSIVGDPLLSQI
jgi:hypothetical protein